MRMTCHWLARKGTLMKGGVMSMRMTCHWLARKGTLRRGGGDEHEDELPLAS